VIPIDGPPINSHARSIPDQEANRHQDRNRIHRTRITRMGDHFYSLDQLCHENDYQACHEQPIAHCAPTNLAQADRREQRRRDEREPGGATTTATGPILCPGTSAESDTANALVKAVSAADARCGEAAPFLDAG
jgi:hypothetical protein